jgi:hypothetical protein
MFQFLTNLCNLNIFDYQKLSQDDNHIESDVYIKNIAETYDSNMTEKYTLDVNQFHIEYIKKRDVLTTYEFKYKNIMEKNQLSFNNDINNVTITLNKHLYDTSIELSQITLKIDNLQYNLGGALFFNHEIKDKEYTWDVSIIYFPWFTIMIPCIIPPVINQIFIKDSCRNHFQDVLIYTQ